MKKWGGGLAVSSKEGLIKELERHVEALEETSQVEVSSYMSFLDKDWWATTGILISGSYYTEEELREVYEDVLVVPVPQSERPIKKN